MARQVLENGRALKADDAVFFERPPENERGSRQAPWLTLMGDFTQCCGGSEREAWFWHARELECDRRPIQRIEIAR